MRAWLVAIALVAGTLAARPALAGVAATRPAEPLVTHLRVQVYPGSAERRPVDYLWFDSRVSQETTTLEITIEDRFGTQTITTTPDRTYMNNPDLRLALGKLTIDIVAIDRDGNRSDPNRWHFVRASEGRRCGAYGAMILFICAPFFLVGLVASLSALVSLFRMCLPRDRGEPVPQLVAEYLVDRELRRARTASVLWGLAFAAAVHFDADVIAAVFAVPALVALLTFFVAHGMRTELAGGDARAELSNGVLIIHGSQGHARLPMAPGTIDQAQQHAVPRSKAL
jgi:hypothetical protein